MIIDTHAHIYLEEFAEDSQQIIDRAKEAGVDKVILPNIDITTIDSLVKACEDHPDFYLPMVGLHPCYVKEDYKVQLEQLYSYITKTNCKAIGEIGIDFYWDNTFREQQIEAYKEQIEWSRTHGIPVAIHSRDALDLTISIMEEMQDGSLTGVYHCFNGTVEQSKRIVDLGFYMGIGGVVTFKNAGVDKVVKELPLESLVVETDSPYLSPTPYRGKRNEPAYVEKVIECMSELFDMSENEVAQRTTENAKKLFSI